MKRISIITINYNNAAGLEKTMQSVLAQSSSDWEYVVIDGGSTDDSRQIIGRHKARLSHWVSEKDKGIYNAMNKGIAASQGEYLLFLNSGDRLANASVLSDVAPQLDGTDIVYGDIITQDKNGVMTYEASPDQPDARHFMLSTLWHPASFIRKTLFDKFGLFDEAYKVAADYGFFVKTIVCHRASTRHIQLPVAIFDLNGISNNQLYFDTVVKERKQIQQALFSPEQLKTLKQVQVFQTGRNSRLFKLIPPIEFIRKLYDRFYFRWYNWRVK